MYSQLKSTSVRDEELENKIPDYTISITELKAIIYNNLSYDITGETLELIFYALGLPLYQDTKVDFLLFVKIYYLIAQKVQMDSEENEEAEIEGNNRYNGEEEEMPNEQNQNVESVEEQQQSEQQ